MSVVTTDPTHVAYRNSPSVTNDELNILFAAAWPNHEVRDFGPVLDRSLCFVCAYLEIRLVGFVNLAWDGGHHAFVLDTTVHPSAQRRGIGQQLVKRSAEAARMQGVEWLHVDYEPRLQSFYAQCGFQTTKAGLLNLKRCQDEV